MMELREVCKTEFETINGRLRLIKAGQRWYVTNRRACVVPYSNANGYATLMAAARVCGVRWPGHRTANEHLPTKET